MLCEMSTSPPHIFNPKLKAVVNSSRSYRYGRHSEYIDASTDVFHKLLAYSRMVPFYKNHVAFSSSFSSVARCPSTLSSKLDSRCVISSGTPRILLLKLPSQWLWTATFTIAAICDCTITASLCTILFKRRTGYRG